MLHEGNAAALDRLRHEDLRHVVRRHAHRGKCFRKSHMVMTVAGFDVPAEGAQLPLEVAEREDLLGRPVGLELVAVDNRPEIADALVCGRSEGLPVLSLLQLPVPARAG
jgi:hypothetical protein